MKEFIDSIKAQLTAYAPSIKHMAIFNNQYENIRYEEPAKGYLFDMPAVFIELDLSNIKQLGAGYQMFEPLPVIIHIVMQQLDSQDGGLDENTDIFTLRNEVLLALQKFKPYQGSEMCRTAEEPDYDHKNMYVFRQTYITTYVDPVPKDIIRGQVFAPPVTIETTNEIVENIE